MEERLQNTQENNTEAPEKRLEQEVGHNNSSEVTNPIPTTATPPIPSEMPVR